MSRTSTTESPERICTLTPVTGVKSPTGTPQVTESWPRATYCASGAAGADGAALGTMAADGPEGLKAFLAYLPADEIEHYLAQSLPKVTRSTVTDRRALAKELEAIVARGWARSKEERQTGAASVAAPVLDRDGRPVAVLSVCGPADRFGPEAEACAERLLESTRKLSTRLGYRG